ncbi:MAG: thioredoxin TrxC [Gammaproteobacteria bacterium]
MSDPLHIVCPACFAVNRIPAARLAERPKCGKCREQLFNGHPVELHAANFQTFVQRNDVPVVVDFWAPWCGPCRSMAPAYAQAAAQLEPQVRLAKLNTEAEQSLAAQFAIRSIPTLVLFKNGRETARQSGALPAGEILHWVEAHC